MSVTNRCKTVTFSGSQCFAMLRAMATREIHLIAQIKLAKLIDEDQELIGYLEDQLVDIRANRTAFKVAPFSEGATPKPIQLESQKQLFEVEAAMEEAIYALAGRIQLFGPAECDTYENLTERLAAAKAAYDIVRRAF
jgi:hypothetical protein